MSGTNKGLPRQVRGGKTVSDEALANFYRQRSESIRRTPNTTTVPVSMSPKPLTNIYNYLVTALGGNPQK